jgi:hypothetical protein
MTEPAAGTPPSDPLMEFILRHLTQFLLTGAITDPGLARRAATETIAVYQPAGPDQLITIAQIVAFALAAIDTIGLSLRPGLSTSMILKLRGSANALTRSSHRATTTLDAQRRDTPAPELDPTEVLAALETAKTQVRQAQSTKPSTGRRADLSWANAMTDVATEYSAELAHLPPAQRRTHLARIGALSEIALALGRGDAPPLKDRLLGSTSLRG